MLFRLSLTTLANPFYNFTFFFFLFSFDGKFVVVRRFIKAMFVSEKWQGKWKKKENMERKWKERKKNKEKFKIKYHILFLFTT